MEKYTVILEEDENGDLILPLPAELSEGDNPWLVGDNIRWTVNEDNSVWLENLSWKERQHDTNQSSNVEDLADQHLFIEWREIK